MFLLHAQSEDQEWMEKYAKDRGLTLPIPMKLECNFEAYDGNRRITLPYAYVIGPDGVVAWQGKTGYEAEVRKQLARIKYPKLRRMEVLPQVAKAAADFEAGSYASARAAAVKLRESSMQEGATDEALFADAQFVIDAVDEHVVKLHGRIDELKATRRYHEALPLLEELSGKAYAGMDASTEAKEELKKLKADKDVKAELKAWGELEKMLEANKKVKEPKDRRKNIQKFIARNVGTAAAEEAATLLEAD